jgi:uncharacterized protein (UPF0548 family)
VRLREWWDASQSDPTGAPRVRRPPAMSGVELWQRPVSYGAVGATQAADLMQYPPSGFRPIERRVRVGHGDERWDYAWNQLFTWGIQRLSGMRVELSDTPGEVTELTYIPVGFDSAGTPVAPATVDSSGEALYGPDGTAFLRPGDTANLLHSFRSVPCGFAGAGGLCGRHPRSRKVLLTARFPGTRRAAKRHGCSTHSDDGSVWLTIRAFSRPSSVALVDGLPRAADRPVASTPGATSVRSPARSPPDVDAERIAGR